MIHSLQPSLALIGAGHWGKNLARNFYALGALHTICDAKQSLLDGYKDTYPDVHLTTDFQKVIQNPAITKVVIAAPAARHYTLAKQALLAGKDTYVEKPLCLDSSEGEELIQLASKMQCILMVGHLLQYHPCVRKLQEMVKKGEIGKLQHIVSHRLNLGQIRTEENALWSFAPHDISVILSLSNQLPERIRCTGAAYLSNGVADTTMTTMQFSDNLHAHIYVSWLNPFKEQKLVVVGSTGMVVFDDTKPWKEKLILYRNYITWKEGSIPQANKIEGEAIEVLQAEPLHEECAHFLKCCQERLTPRTDGKEGLNVLKVLQAAQASLDENGEVKNPQDSYSNNLQPNYFAHPTAVVHKKAEVGCQTKIWHFSHIMEDSKIGKACNLGQNVVISPKVTLGDNVKVQNNVSIYTGVTCENDVFLGPSVVFTNVLNPRSAVNRRGEYLQTYVRQGASIGANATIVCGITIGEFAFIGAGAVVTKDIKPYALIVGNPGKQIGWMSRHGERLNLPLKIEEGQEQHAECPATGERYTLKGSQVVFNCAIQKSK
jgi:UDP-2-acetamido-3-amino-2,3-dideoxy-glucuronate N-acetyltransferase